MESLNSGILAQPTGECNDSYQLKDGRKREEIEHEDGAMPSHRVKIQYPSAPQPVPSRNALGRQYYSKAILTSDLLIEMSVGIIG
jgi:hypothetical protein